MKSVKVYKAELLKILQQNRVDHKAIFLKAQDKFREVAIAELDRQLKAAREQQPFVLERITRLVQPQDYSVQYDRAIKMLEMSVEDTVEITAQEFQNFVQDIWDWSRTWAYSNSRYTDSPKFAGLLEDDNE